MTKPTKWVGAQRRIKISQGIHSVWSESSLSAWRKLGSLATHWVDSKDSDQTWWMPRLIGIFTGCTLILLVLSWCGSCVSMCQFIFAINVIYLQKRDSKKTKKEEQNVTIPAPDTDSLASLDSSRAASPQSEVRVEYVNMGVFGVGEYEGEEKRTERSKCKFKDYWFPQQGRDSVSRTVSSHSKVGPLCLGFSLYTLEVRIVGWVTICVVKCMFRSHYTMGWRSQFSSGIVWLY